MATAPTLPLNVGAHRVASFAKVRPAQNRRWRAVCSTISYELPLLLLLSASLSASAGERINHEGRLLGPAPVVTQPVLFNTPEADAFVAAMQVMPVTSAWNENIVQRPILANSAAMIAQITADLASNRRTLRPFFEMNYVLVPDDQPTQPVRFFNYPGESDLDGGVSPRGLYPIPANLPIETWPVGTGTQTLTQWQQDVNNAGGDRHSIMVKPGAGVIWETWLTRLVNGSWEASNGAKFSLNSNALRPAGWTSGDAAGLPMFPALVRYDECQRGMVEHALRLVVKRSRVGPIYPATHQASVGNLTDPNIPAMGQRLRLKASFVIPSTWTKEEKAVLLGLKKYGAIVADNGGFFSVSVAPDSRFQAGVFDHLSTITISNFEVISTTGATEGPRSPGAPVAGAGPGSVISFGTSATLRGSSSGMGTVQWRAGSGPGVVSFGTPNALTTTATFSEPGRYVLVLGIDDGVHAVAFDSVEVLVTLQTNITRTGGNAVVTFPSVTGRQYRLESCATLPATGWVTLFDNIAGTGETVQLTDLSIVSAGRQFYRVRVLP